MSQSDCRSIRKVVWWWVVGGGGTVIITYAPGPGLCHSQRFFERFFGDSLRDSLEMDLVRSLTICFKCNLFKAGHMLEK